MSSPEEAFNIPIVGKLVDSPAFFAGKCHDRREPRKEIPGSAMRADRGANIQREFHFVKRSLKISRGNSSKYGLALVALNIGPISANNPVQAPTTTWIAE
jgi:hypothetical protein